MTLVVTATGCIVLAAAVFLWGLEYKVSLYPGHEAKRIPIAKLLSERERPASVPSGAMAGPSAALVLLTLAWFLAVAIPDRPRISRAATALTAAGGFARRAASCFVYFSFRPPPIASL